MHSILSITGPIYLAVAAGLAATCANWFAAADLRAFGQFVVPLALPMLMFEPFST